MPKAPYWLFVVLVLVLAGLQYRLWAGDGSLAQVTEPPEGALFVQDKPLAHGQSLRGVKGSEVVVTCKMFRHEAGRVKVVFDGDKTVTCRMPELKDPFAP